MKKIFTILTAVLLTATLWAQSPEKMSYQAVIRNSNDALVTNQSVGMQISILQSSAGGTVVYMETQTPTTNTNGLVSIEIGGGTVVNGNFSAIDWANGPYFIKTETDPVGGTSYTITGTSQLLSVPYALHAKEVENIDYSQITNTPTINGSETIINVGKGINISGTGTSGDPYVISENTPTYTIGLNEDLGGYVFYVTPDGKHGLVAETQDQSTSCKWNNAQDTISDPVNHSTAGRNFTDWRLPTKFELNLMYSQKANIDGFISSWYWSSAVDDNDYPWLQNFNDGSQATTSKITPYLVRSVRAF
jgi:hypothetical protein